MTFLDLCNCSHSSSVFVLTCIYYNMQEIISFYFFSCFLRGMRDPLVIKKHLNPVLQFEDHKQLKTFSFPHPNMCMYPIICNICWPYDSTRVCIIRTEQFPLWNLYWCIGQSEFCTPGLQCKIWGNLVLVCLWKRRRRRWICKLWNAIGWKYLEAGL